MYYKREVMWFVEGRALLGRKRQEGKRAYP